MEEVEWRLPAAEHRILKKIFLVRGQKVMLDKDLAAMYGVETRRLNEQVKRNLKRFPEDFMFTLTTEEHADLMSQSAISSWGGRRKLPHVFTEQGVAMLSSVLSSDIAIEVNIQIIRVFTKLREYAQENNEILVRLSKLEQELKGNSKDIDHIFVAINELIEKRVNPVLTNKIGFKLNDETE